MTSTRCSARRKPSGARGAVVCSCSRARRGSARRRSCGPRSSPTAVACSGARAIRWRRRARSVRCVDVADELGGEFAVRIDEGAGPGGLFTSLGATLRRRPPAILVLEDLHWADEATLDFLRFAGRRIGELNALVVVDLPRRRSSTGRIRCGSRSASCRPRRRSRAGASSRSPPMPSSSSPRTRTSTPSPFTCAPAGTRSSSARCLPPARRFPRPSATPCSRGSRAWIPRVAAAARGGRDHPLAGGDRAARVDRRRRDRCAGRVPASGMLQPAGSAVRFRHEIARAAVEETLPPQRAVDLHRRTLRFLAERRGRCGSRPPGAPRRGGRRRRGRPRARPAWPPSARPRSAPTARPRPSWSAPFGMPTDCRRTSARRCSDARRRSIRWSAA